MWRAPNTHDVANFHSARRNDGDLVTNESLYLFKQRRVGQGKTGHFWRCYLTVGYWNGRRPGFDLGGASLAVEDEPPGVAELDEGLGDKAKFCV